MEQDVLAVETAEVVEGKKARKTSNPVVNVAPKEAGSVRAVRSGTIREQYLNELKAGAEAKDTVLKKLWEGVWNELGYGIRTEETDNVFKYFLVLPEGLEDIVVRTVDEKQPRQPRQPKEKKDRKSKLKAKSLSEDLPVDEDSVLSAEPAVLVDEQEVAIY